MFTAAMFTFFLRDYYYMQAQNNILSHLMGSPAWITITWKWASPLTRLARDGESRLTRFHVIRNFLANKFNFFSGCPTKRAVCPTYLASLLYIIIYVFSHFFCFRMLSCIKC